MDVPPYFQKRYDFGEARLLFGFKKDLANKITRTCVVSCHTARTVLVPSSRVWGDYAQKSKTGTKPEKSKACFLLVW